MKVDIRHALLVLLLAFAMPRPNALSAQEIGPSLYQRMGGYDVIAAVVDDFIARFDADPALAPFLGGLNEAAGKRIRQNFVDFFCEQAEGPCVYNGRDMGSAHQGLRITSAHFDSVIRHLGAALAAADVAEAERREFVALATALRAEIVRPPL